MIRLRAGKRHGAGSTPGAYSDTISPRSRDPSRELRVRRRIVAVDAAAEDGDRERRPPRARRGAPRASIAAREAADDDDARRRELTAERRATWAP